MRQRGRPRKTGLSLLQAIIERYQAGEPGPALAREAGISRATLYAELRRAGCRIRARGNVPRSHQSLIDAADDEIARRRAEGETLRSIAESLGVSRQRIEHRLARHSKRGKLQGVVDPS